MLYTVRIRFDIFFDFVNENEQHRGFITLVTQSMHRRYVKYVCILLFILIVNNYYSYFFTSPPSTQQFAFFCSALCSPSSSSSAFPTSSLPCSAASHNAQADHNGDHDVHLNDDDDDEEDHNVLLFCPPCSGGRAGRANAYPLHSASNFFLVRIFRNIFKEALCVDTGQCLVNTQVETLNDQQAELSINTLFCR